MAQEVLGLKDSIKKNSTLLATIALLAFIWLGLSFVAPKMSLFCFPDINIPADSTYVDLEEGAVYEQSFPMPYDVISKVSVDLTWDETHGNIVVPFDGRIELLDSNGNIIAGKIVTSIYDAELNTRMASVNQDETYTVRFTVNSIDAPEGAAVPEINADGSSPAYTIYGRYNGAPARSFFHIMYLVLAAIIVLYVYSLNSKSEELRRTSEKLLLWGICLVCILLLGQSIDMEMVARGSLKIIEALKSGQFFSYYNYSYDSALEYGVTQVYMGYNYDFFLMLPMVILIFPVSFFMNSGMPYWQGYNGIIIGLSIVVFVLILVCEKIIVKICKACGMPKEYEETVRKFFLFSPFLLTASIMFGQIDMIYVLVIAIALVFYFKGSLKTFTILMSLAVAMKSLPLMIFIPLIILVRKNVMHIMGYLAGVLAFPAVSAVLFERGAGYDAIMNIVNSEFGFGRLLFERTLDGANALFPLFYVFICVYAYAHKCEGDSKKELLKTSMLIIFMTYASFTAFTVWHLQWLIPLIFALAFLIPMYSKNRTVLAVGIVMEMLLILCVIGDDQVATYEINFLMPVFTDHDYHGIFVSEILKNISPYAYTAVRSLLTASLAALTYLFIKQETTVEDKDMTFVKRAACLRIFALYAVVIFFIWCYCFVG